MYYYSMPKSKSPMSIIVFYRHIALCTQPGKRVNSPYPSSADIAIIAINKERFIVSMTCELAMAKKVGCILDVGYGICDV